jgi:hypothetical protein
MARDAGRMAASRRQVNTMIPGNLYVIAYRIAKDRGMNIQGLIRRLLSLYAASVLGPRIDDPAAPGNGADSGAGEYAS